jgi:hypothetical protein
MATPHKDTDVWAGDPCLDLIGDLSRKSLLQLKAMGRTMRDPGEFG